MPEPATFASQPEKNRFDRMRAALSCCTFLPGSQPKRFAKQVAQMPLDRVTEGQRKQVFRYAQRFRRQMPFDLIPTDLEMAALDWEKPHA